MNTDQLVPLGPNVTRDGRKARVICNDLAGASRPVVATIEIRNTPNSEVTSYHFANGTVCLDGRPSPADLVGHLPPEARKPRECWINVGPQGQLNAPHDDRNEAAAVCARNYRTTLFREVLPGADDELADLRRWKDEAMQVLNGIDLQAIGKELGLPLGTDIEPKILPYIRTLKTFIGKLKQPMVCAWVERDAQYLLEP